MVALCSSTKYTGISTQACPISTQPWMENPEHRNAIPGSVLELRLELCKLGVTALWRAKGGA